VVLELVSAKAIVVSHAVEAKNALLLRKLSPKSTATQKMLEIATMRVHPQVLAAAESYGTEHQARWDLDMRDTRLKVSEAE
jgi:hypothetical protein